MRIAYVTEDDHHCGVNEYGFAQAKALQHYAEVHLIATNRFVTIPAFIFQAEAIRPDVVLFNWHPSKLSEMIVCWVCSYFQQRGIQTRIIHHVLRPPIGQFCSVFRHVEHFVHSEDAVAFLKYHAIERAHYIGLGIEDLRIDGCLRAQVPPDPPIFYQPGFLAPHKGHRQFLEPFSRFLSEHPGARYVTSLSQNKYADSLFSQWNAEFLERIRHFGLEASIDIRYGYPVYEEMVELCRAATCVVLPYRVYEPDLFESSAAVRIPLTTGTPVLVSGSEFFDDVREMVMTFRHTHEIPALLKRSLDGLTDEHRMARETYLNTWSWDGVAREMVRVLTH